MHKQRQRFADRHCTIVPLTPCKKGVYYVTNVHSVPCPIGEPGCRQPISLYYPNSPCKRGVPHRRCREHHLIGELFACLPPWWCGQAHLKPLGYKLVPEVPCTMMLNWFVPVEAGYASRAVHLYPDGGQFGFARSSARAPHGRGGRACGPTKSSQNTHPKDITALLNFW